jgi:hypothetical protein
VGAEGTVRHYGGTGHTLDIVSGVPTTVALHAVWGASSSDVWAVGDNAVVIHYDGTSWSRVKVAALGSRRPTLYAIWTPAAGRVLAGGDGVVLSLGGTP